MNAEARVVEVRQRACELQRKMYQEAEEKQASDAGLGFREAGKQENRMHECLNLSAQVRYTNAVRQS